MEHQKSKSIVVYVTDNYRLFKRIDGNRATNKTKKEKIKAQILAGNDILDEDPILVKEHRSSLLVLDGQNRLEICEELSRPVHYIIKKQDMSMHNVAKINSNVEKWTNKDFINCYNQSGKPDYKKIADFQKKYRFAIGVSLMLLSVGSLKSDTGAKEQLMESFQMGTYEVKCYKEACQLAEICKQFEAFPAWNSRGFVVAICKILDEKNCDFNVLMKKFLRDTSKLKVQSNWKDYATNLQAIYNIDNTKQRQIF